MAVEIDKDNFENEVMQSDIPVLAYFHLPNCAKCVVMMSVGEGLEERNNGKLKLAKFNITKNQGLAKKLGVMSAPYFLIIKNGEEIGRFYGESLIVDDIEDFIDKTV